VATGVGVMRFGQSVVDDKHPDFETLGKLREGILLRISGSQRLNELLPGLIKDAVDFVLDPVKTGRTELSELDRVEKTFIGLKIEHYLRDLLDAPKGIRRDMQIDGVDIDIKNTVGSSWMIPPETYRVEEPCLLIATAKADGRCWLGLMIAREVYLGAPNRDGKRSVSEYGRQNILWLVEGEPYPASAWVGVDMARFRELRRANGGTKRAAQFFRENMNRRIPRTVIQALLHDQRDYMKRVRGNGGARDLLRKEGILLLSGTYDSKQARLHGFNLTPDEFLALAEVCDLPRGG
jgi:Restriction endonuclease NaeI